jgi:hypothetical protein
MFRKAIILLSVTALCLIVASVIAAEPEAPDALTMSWWTVDSGGGGSVGGPYLLGGTIGQADAQTSSGGVYTVIGGFWNPLVAPSYTGWLYLPSILK